MSTELLKTYLTAYGVKFQQTRGGVVDVHDDDIPWDVAASLRRLSIVDDQLVEHPEEVHQVAAQGLHAIATICGFNMSGWDKESFFTPIEE